MTDPMLIEIDDELRAQQLKQFWADYGQWLIGLALIIIITTAVGVIWHTVLTNSLTKQSNELLQVLQTETQQKDTAETLKDLNRSADFPLKAVIGMYRAQKLEQGKDLKAAQNVYKDMMDQSRLSKIVQNLSRVHYVRLGIVLNQDPAELIKTLEPITKNDNASFRPSALELQGMLLAQQGKQDEANKIFSQLSSNNDTPANLRVRAKSLVGYDAKSAK